MAGCPPAYNQRSILFARTAAALIGKPTGERLAMSETITASPKPKSTRTGAGDKDIFVQVEKWMALIREVSREQAKS
jgi:hypothetical protein